MAETSVFALADHALNDVVAQIRDDQWELQMPASFATAASGHPPMLREVIASHAYDDAWVPDMLAGRSMAQVGEGAFTGDLLGDDPRGAFARIVEAAVAAAESLDDLERVVHCSFGDYPAREYLWQVSSFRGLRAHDIARVVGVDAGLGDELVRGLWDELSPVADQWRVYGVFPTAVPVPDDAPLLDRLLGLTGRDPTD